MNREGNHPDREGYGPQDEDKQAAVERPGCSAHAGSHADEVCPAEELTPFG